jgi:hypothetical protein
MRPIIQIIFTGVRWRFEIIEFFENASVDLCEAAHDDFATKEDVVARGKQLGAEVFDSAGNSL